MTSRPFKHKRPLSAIFLGPSPSASFTSSSSIPDLPEPPSPGGSSNESGLPSPPATNSTGSGSAGDNSTSAGSIRLRSPSKKNTSMPNVNNDRPRNKSRSSSEEEEGGDNENEEDHTAKLTLSRRPSVTSSSENVQALERVKSLTERNRMVIDKLSSISRLNTPSPSHNSRSNSTSRSPNPPVTPSSSSSSSATSSSRLSHHKSQSSPQTRHRDHLSGSETEREDHSLHSYPSSDDLSVTPPSTLSGSSRPSFAGTRPRRISAPASPDKLRGGRSTEAEPSASRETRNASPGPSRPPRKRVSIASSLADQTGDNPEETDVASAALAAVAASRRSPTGGNSKRARQPLPKEFRDSNRRSLDGRQLSFEPTTPFRNRDRTIYFEGRGSPSPKSAGSTLNLSSLQQSPRPVRASAGRSVRELSRRHQSRWMSEDLSATLMGVDIDDNESDLNAAISPSGHVYGKRQTIRGGSAESALGAGRSLVGEGLKAAGISARRKDITSDVFRDETEWEGSTSLARARSAGTGLTTRHSDWAESSRTGGISRISEGAGPSSSTAGGTKIPSDLRTSTPSADNRVVRRPSVSRPASSMAGYAEEPPKTAPPTLRTYRSAYALPERERTISEASSMARPQVQKQTTLVSNDRMYASPSTAPRQTPHSFSSMSGQIGQSSSEHTRLMLESLSMFESSLSRLPPMGTSTTVTIPELFRSAQTIVHASEKLNGLLRTGTANALERQIDADVSDEDIDGSGEQLAEVWRAVGGDFRESLRVSDELVRTMTGFLLGVGKVLRDGASLSQHSRTGSLDEESRRTSPETITGSGRRSTEGRNSTDSRRSWEAVPTDVVKQFSSRFDDGGNRPVSSLRLGRESEGSTSEDRDRGLSRNGSGGQTSAVRRLFMPREQREQQLVSSISGPDPQDAMEPSPTPTSRHQAVDRHRALPPLSIPPALSTVPSESLLTRKTSALEKSNSRRKISSNSNATVRASPMPSTLKNPGATTALTPRHVSSSPEKKTFPLARVDSSGSGSSHRTNVTFSRPSTVSVSTLSGLQDRARKRTISATSSAADDDVDDTVITSTTAVRRSKTPISVSDAERDRDNRRRTIGARPRVSLDSAISSESYGTGGSSSVRNAPLPAGKKERRKTITEIFGQR